jgi:hyperosmotically inducible periplasmic protein
MKAYIPQSKALLLSALLIGVGISASPVGADQDQPQKEKLDLKTDFEKHDTNRDGYISLDEFKAQERSERAFNEGDDNKDGRLNQDEFVKARSIDQRIQAGELIDDAWITTKVKALLLKEGFLAGLEIGVKTKDGTVHLSGTVETADQAKRAVEIAAA